MAEKTRQSKLKSACRERRREGAEKLARRESHQPMPAPATPPTTESKRLSVRSWRMRRTRPAPNAARTASSLARPEARTRRRFARFTQVTTRTSATIARKTVTTSGIVFEAFGSGRAMRSEIRVTVMSLFGCGKRVGEIIGDELERGARLSTCHAGTRASQDVKSMMAARGEHVSESENPNGRNTLILRECKGRKILLELRR